MFPSGKIAPENSTFGENAPVQEHLMSGDARMQGNFGEREHTGRSPCGDRPVTGCLPAERFRRCPHLRQQFATFPPYS
jgi:hypothetical protein